MNDSNAGAQDYFGLPQDAYAKIMSSFQLAFVRQSDGIHTNYVTKIDGSRLNRQNTDGIIYIYSGHI